MTEELKLYLQTSKNSRTKLTNLAKDFKKSLLELSPDSLNTDFPSINAQRFKFFKENLEKELQNFFKDSPSSLLPQTRSRSSQKNRFASVYNCSSAPKPKPVNFPLISKDRIKSIPPQLLNGKYLDRSAESSPTAASRKSLKARIRSRQTPQNLLTPVLKQKSSVPRFKLQDYS